MVPSGAADLPPRKVPEKAALSGDPVGRFLGVAHCKPSSCRMEDGGSWVSSFAKSVCSRDGAHFWITGILVMRHAKAVGCIEAAAKAPPDYLHQPSSVVRSGEEQLHPRRPLARSRDTCGFLNDFADRVAGETAEIKRAGWAILCLHRLASFPQFAPLSYRREL